MCGVLRDGGKGAGQRMMGVTKNRRGLNVWEEGLGGMERSVRSSVTFWERLWEVDSMVELF